MDVATRLTEGPRGRGFLLNLLDSHQRYPELNHTLNTLGRLTFIAGEVTASIAADPRIRKAARLIAEAAPVDRDEAGFIRAVADSVEFAVYWQEPDEMDELSGLEPIRTALRVIGEQVAREPIMDWWNADFDPASQVWVEYPGAAITSLAPDGTQRERWHREQLETQDRFRDFTEPAGGDWWSAPRLLAHETSRRVSVYGAGGLWWMEDSFGWERARLITVEVSPKVRVFEIRCTADWVFLCRRYPLEVTWGVRSDWGMLTGREGRWVMPDWSRVAADFDAVHLSVLGYLSTAGYAIDVNGDTATVLAGWDPDATYWLNEGAQLRTEVENWRRDQGEGDAWSWVPG